MTNSALHREQYAFAAHLRDPQNNPAPADIEGRRMQIYRDLFFNNVRDMLAGTFPVLSDLLGEERWALLIRDFYRDHQSRSPLFPDMPREFLHYLVEERATGNRSDSQEDPPFMYELAHYEWVEAGLLLTQEPSPPQGLQTEIDLLDSAPVTSAVAWLLAYSWPVNEIGKDSIPDKPAAQPLYYLVYRDTSEEIIFMTLNAVSARLFEIISGDEVLTGRHALEQLGAELKLADADKLIEGGSKILEEWRARGVIIGSLTV